jgi:hypothetical protein
MAARSAENTAVSFAGYPGYCGRYTSSPCWYPTGGVVRTPPVPGSASQVIAAVQIKRASARPGQGDEQKIRLVVFTDPFLHLCWVD